MKYLFTPPGMLMVGANAGIVGMTKEHLGLALALSVPVFVVVTKIDMCPPNVLQVNLTFDYEREKYLKLGPKYSYVVFVITHLNSAQNLFRRKLSNCWCEFYALQVAGNFLF